MRMYSCKGVIIGVSCKEVVLFACAWNTIPSHVRFCREDPQRPTQPNTSSPCLYQRTYQIRSRPYCLWAATSYHSSSRRAVRDSSRRHPHLTHMSEILTLKFVVLPLVVQVQPTEEVQVLHDVRSTNIVSILSIASREARDFQNVRLTACR